MTFFEKPALGSRLVLAAFAAGGLTFWPWTGRAQAQLPISLTYEQRSYTSWDCARAGTVNKYLVRIINSGPAVTLRASGAAGELSGLALVDTQRNVTYRPSAVCLIDPNASVGSPVRLDSVSLPTGGSALLAVEFNLPDGSSATAMRLIDRSANGTVAVTGCRVAGAGERLPCSGTAAAAAGGAIGRAGNAVDRATATVDRANRTMDSASQTLDTVNRLKDGLRGLFGGGSAPATDAASGTAPIAPAGAPPALPNLPPAPSPQGAYPPPAEAGSAAAIAPRGSFWAAAQEVAPALRMLPAAPQAGAPAATQAATAPSHPVAVAPPQPTQRPPARAPEAEPAPRQQPLDGARIGGLDGRPIDLDSNDFRYAPARAAYERFKALVPMTNGDLNDFRYVYGGGYAPRTQQQVALKQALDPLFEQVRAMPPQGQAEVMARVIRDIKATNDFNGSDGGVLSGVLGVLTQVPLARDFSVQYKQRPRNGQGVDDDSIDPAHIEPDKSKSIREYLSQRTIIMNSNRTAAACDWQNINTTFDQAAERVSRMAAAGR
jgi:hypothetical protein